MLATEGRSKLQDNVVVSVEGGIVVHQSLQNTQLADVVNKVFKCVIFAMHWWHQQYLWGYWGGGGGGVGRGGGGYGDTKYHFTVQFFSKYWLLIPRLFFCIQNTCFIKT